jgi:DNA-binding response OmpR family regulator
MELDTKRTVLLVEDHPPEREAIRRALVSQDFNVETAADYHAAVGYLSKFVPHLVCLDLTLPRESGFELCEYIRNDVRHKFVPVLVMSDRSSPEDMAHAEYVGANAFLKKPFTRDKLLKYVVTLLDGPHASRPSVRRLRRSDVPDRDGAIKDIALKDAAALRKESVAPLDRDAAPPRDGLAGRGPSGRDPSDRQ